MKKILKNKVIKSEEFDMKESRRCNVSVSINHHQYRENILSSVTDGWLVQILDFVCISQNAKTFGKGMYPTLLPLAIGKL